METLELATEWQNKQRQILAAINTDPSEALSLAEEFAEMTENFIHHAEVRSYLTIGHCYCAARDFGTAAYLYQTIINSDVHDPILQCEALRNLAYIKSEEGAQSAAFGLLKQAIHAAQMSGERIQLGKVLINYSTAFQRFAEYRKSFKAATGALTCFRPSDDDHSIAAHNCLVATVSLAMSEHGRGTDLARDLLDKCKKVRTRPQYAAYSDYLTAMGHLLAGYPRAAANILPNVRNRLVKRRAPLNHVALTYIDEAQSYHLLEYSVDRREALRRAAAYYSDPIQEKIASLPDDIEPWQVRSLAYAPAEQTISPPSMPLRPRLRAMVPKIIRGMLKKT